MAHREIPPMRGPGRAIAVSLIVLVLLVVAADIGLRLWTEAWLRHRIEETLDLPRQPEVSLGGFPFLHEFAGGRLDEVEARMEGFVAQGLPVDRAALRLQGVEFSQRDLLTGRGGTVEVDRGSLQVVVGEEAFTTFLRDREIRVIVEMIGPRMRATVTLEVGDQEVTATAIHRPELEDGALVFRPDRVRVAEDVDVSPGDLSFELPLPPVVPQIAYERLRVEEGRAILEASLDRTQVELALAPGRRS